MYPLKVGEDRQRKADVFLRHSKSLMPAKEG
jgi:hypothetical protein